MNICMIITIRHHSKSTLPIVWKIRNQRIDHNLHQHLVPERRLVLLILHRKLANLSQLSQSILFSDYAHGEKPLDEVDEKFSRVPPVMTPYRPSKSISLLIDTFSDNFIQLFLTMCLMIRVQYLIQILLHLQFHLSHIYHLKISIYSIIILRRKMIIFFFVHRV